MAQSGQIGKREHAILTAIVETYIATGEPVGSRALAHGNPEGLSPASIRNVMADLAESGYLEQPHTSAGRVPTPEAYRYFVEQISGKAHLSRADEGLIQGSFRGVSDVQEFMAKEGGQPVGSTPDELTAMFKREVAKYAKVIEAGHIAVQ